MSKIAEGECVEQLSDAGGCPVCDAGTVAHTTADGVVYLCPLHLDGLHA